MIDHLGLEPTTTSLLLDCLVSMNVIDVMKMITRCRQLCACCVNMMATWAMPCGNVGDSRKVRSA